MWFIGVEVEQETSAPPPKKNPGSAPVLLPLAVTNGGGGGDAYFVTLWSTFFFCPWTVMYVYWKTVLWIVIEVRLRETWTAKILDLTERFWHFVPPLFLRSVKNVNICFVTSEMQNCCSSTRDEVQDDGDVYDRLRLGWNLRFSRRNSPK